jgi:spore coat protein U-like protein
MLRKLALIGTIATLAVPGTALASTSTGTLAVSLTVQTACTLTGTSAVAFGSQSNLSSSVDTTGSLSVLCSNTTPYTIALDEGGGTGATTAVRKLTNGSNTVDYVLYRDAGRTQTWGKVTGTDTVAGTGNGSTQTVTVYGRVPAQTTPAPASYTDTVNVTVTY